VAAVEPVLPAGFEPVAGALPAPFGVDSAVGAKAALLGGRVAKFRPMAKRM
jgi:hypothetical protein